MRCFIAIPLPDVVKEGLAEIQEILRGTGGHRFDVSWTRPEGIHLTLKFLGEVEEAAVARIIAAVAPPLSGIPPFHLRIRGMGCFPGPSSPRVVWVGVEESEGVLNRLQQGVEKAAESLGFPPENRKFTPHLTVGRVRSPIHRETLIRRVEENREIDLGEVEVREVHLMESILKPEGAIYRIVKTFPLNG